MRSHGMIVLVRPRFRRLKRGYTVGPVAALERSDTVAVGRATASDTLTAP